MVTVSVWPRMAFPPLGSLINNESLARSVANKYLHFESFNLQYQSENTSLRSTNILKISPPVKYMHHTVITVVSLVLCDGNYIQDAISSL